jgi:uncharacterized protein with NRDE domain
MCTIVILQRVHPDYPVVVAANRDELYARHATAPLVLNGEPRVVGGRDELSGGTWMGVTEHGLFVGLTNQRSYTGADPSARSRGHVVLDALRAGTRAAVTQMLESLDAREYNPFNLVYGDAAGLHVGYARRTSAHIEVHAVPDGLQILPNDELNSAAFPKGERARALAATDGPVQGLASVLRDHELPALDAVEAPPAGSLFTHALAHRLQALCIHTPAYGTKSSSIIALAPGRVAGYWFADGPPCTTAFDDVTALVTTESS